MKMFMLVSFMFTVCGEIQNVMRNGFGTETLLTGEKTEGYWKNDLFLGPSIENMTTLAIENRSDQNKL